MFEELTPEELMLDEEEDEVDNTPTGEEKDEEETDDLPVEDEEEA